MNQNQLTFLWKKDLEKMYTKWADENFDLWESNKLSASQRRILFSSWVSEAWKMMKKRHVLINQMFSKCGIILRKDGSDKHLIKVGDVGDYEIPF